MQNVSSQLTLFWKFLVPVFWLSFFLTLTLGFTFSEVSVTGVPRSYVIILGFVTLALGLILFLMTLLRLKRVEMDEHFIYVSNYIKWYKYPYHNVASMTERDLVLLKLVFIKFKEPGNFGKSVFFLANHRALNAFLEENPEVAGSLREVADLES